MGGSGLIHLPQLAIQPDQPPNPVDQYGKLVSIQNLSAQGQQQRALMPGQLQAQQQQLQAGLLDNQQKQLQLKQVQAMNSAFQGALTPDPTTGQPKFDSGKVLSSIAASGNGSLVPQLSQTFTKLDQDKATLLKTKQDAASAQQDYEGSLGAEVKSAGYGPGAAGIALAHMAEVNPQRASQLQQQFTQNPALVKQWADTAIAGSPKQQEAIKNKSQSDLADTENLLKQQDLNFGAKVPQLNAALQQRYQVLHPGQTLPTPFRLGPNASKADFDRVDKILDATERSQGTKAQQDTANAMRQSMVDLAQNRSNTQSVVGTDPSTGKEVVASFDDAMSMGLTGIRRAGASQVRQTDAGNAEQLASKIMDAAGGDPDAALKLFDQRAPQVTDPSQLRLAPQIRAAIRARRQINKPVSPIDRILNGDIDGGLNGLTDPNGPHPAPQ